MCKKSRKIKKDISGVFSLANCVFGVWNDTDCCSDTDAIYTDISGIFSLANCVFGVWTDTDCRSDTDAAIAGNSSLAHASRQGKKILSNKKFKIIKNLIFF